MAQPPIDDFQVDLDLGSQAATKIDLTDLRDVSAPSPSDGDALTWDDGQSRWESHPRNNDLGEYTVSGLPSASSYPNHWALVTDASGSPGGRVIVRSDGSDWRIIAFEGAIVS